MSAKDIFHDTVRNALNCINMYLKNSMKNLDAEARKLMLTGKKNKKRKSLLNQANEISRRKSGRADHH